VPFTPAHAAVALPFARVRGVPFTALVIGTQVPDFAMFFPAFLPSYATTHAVSAAALWNLPIGLAILVFWEWVKPSTLALFPAALRKRLRPYAEPHWPRGPLELAAVALAIMVGAASHIVWDAFTHSGRFGTVLIPALQQAWLYRLQGYKILQYGCGVLGTLVVLWAARRRLLQQPPHCDLEQIWLEPVRKAQLILYAMTPLLSAAWTFRTARYWVLPSRNYFMLLFAHYIATTSIAAVLVIAACMRALFELDRLREPRAASTRAP